MKKGFTLIELVMVLSVIAIMASIAVPSYFSMRQEGMYTKAQKEVSFLQAAVENYWQENNKLPENLTNDLINTKTKILTQKAYDPWKTDNTNYGYKVGKTEQGEEYYVIYTKGLADEVEYQISSNAILSKAGNIMVSNLPIISD